MEKKEAIRDFYNRIIGWIYTDTVTNIQTARDFYNRIIGTYNPKDNFTRDFYNRVVGTGNTLTALIWKEDTLAKEKEANKKK